MMRWHVQAWGSDKHPDLDYETDDYPKDLGWKYPIINIACLTPIRASDLDRALDQMERKR